MHSNILRYLDEVARQGSIRKAAKLLNTSSTAVNRKIINVEKQLGVRLFDRSPEGVEITTPGKIILEHCRRTLYDYENVKAIIEDIRDLRTGHLSIQTVDSFSFSILPRILRRFANDYPGITLSITTGYPEIISAAVGEGEIDIGISFTKKLHHNTRTMLEKSAPFGIIMRPDHPLAEKSTIEIDDLQDYPLVRTNDARGQNSILDQEMKTVTMNLKTHIYTNALTIAKQSIIDNRALGVYTQIGFLEEIANKKLTFVPLSQKSLSSYKIGLLVSASAGVDSCKRLFITAADQILRELNFEL